MPLNRALIFLIHSQTIMNWNKYLACSLLTLLFNCAPSKTTTSNDTSEKTKSEPLQVELTLIEKPDYFVWQKDALLDLGATITNLSAEPITILRPRSAYESEPDYFEVHFPESFNGTACVFEVGEDRRRNAEEFITIPPNESVDLYIPGRSYYIQYCNYEESDTTEQIEISLSYNFYQRAHSYDSSSYFIQNNYKATLNEKDQQQIQSRLESIKNSSRFQNLSEEAQANRLLKLEQSFKERMINSTPADQRLIIEKFNSLYPHKVVSNTIHLKLEK